MNGEPNGPAGRAQWSRRVFLRITAGAVLGTTSLSTMVAACGPSVTPSTPTSMPAAAATSLPVTAVTSAPAVAPPGVLQPAAPAAATPAPAGAAAAPTGTLRYASADFFQESMDPITLDSEWGWAMYDSLLTFDSQGNVIGNVAENYELSHDGLTWTFDIQKGIKFHNGDPLTAADVVFSLQRFGSNQSTNPWSPYILKNNESITATDDYTVVYKAQKPEWPLKVPFAWTRILPKNYVERLGQDGFRAAPVGSGPYKFSKWVPKTRMEFDANVDYWGPKPQWAHIIETLVPEEATRVAQLERGEADIIGNLSFDRLLELKAKGFRLQTVGLPTLASLCFPGTWLTQGPTSDVRVRQALSYAINRQELCETFYRGLAKPGGFWFFSEQTWGWDNTFHAHPYDPSKARQLLSDAGYPGKFRPHSITLLTNAVASDLMQALQGYWQAVGVTVDIQSLDTAAFYNVIFGRPKEPTDKNVGIAWPWVGETFFNNVYHCANLFTSTGVLGTGNDTNADQMYQTTVAELDDAKAKESWRQFMHYGYDTMWVNVELVEVPTFFVVGSHVGAFTRNDYRSIWDAYGGIQHGDSR